MRKAKAPIVSGISDFVGGADLPDRSIWDYPHKMLLKARELNSGGNVFKSPPYLVVAAIVTRNNANLLAQYADDSSTGAGRVITVLKVAKTAGQVAEVGLAVTGITGVVRGTVRVAGNAAARDAAVDAAAERMIAKHYANDAEIMSRPEQGQVGSATEGKRGRRRQARHELRCRNRLAQVLISAARNAVAESKAALFANCLLDVASRLISPTKPLSALETCARHRPGPEC